MGNATTATTARLILIITTTTTTTIVIHREKYKHNAFSLCTRLTITTTTTTNRVFVPRARVDGAEVGLGMGGQISSKSIRRSQN